MKIRNKFILFLFLSWREEKEWEDSMEKKKYVFTLGQCCQEKISKNWFNLQKMSILKIEFMQSEKNC